MKVLIALFVVVFVDMVASQCACDNMKWAVCDGEPCQCTLQFADDYKQKLDCTKLIPKCFLMKGEMYRARKNLTTRSIGGKPVETAFVDNDGIYDPECEDNGKFKAVQCNKTDVCWCVNSAGVRRSDKGDKNIKCEPVETYWVRLELKHKAAPGVTLDAGKLKTGIENALLQRYNLDKTHVSDVQYDKDGRLLIVDVKKTVGQPTPDLSLMTYYMEKDIKVLPLFKNEQPFEVSVEGSKVSMESILVYYVDEKAPTFTMQKLTGGIIAVIVVVAVVVLAGLLVLYFLGRRQKARYSKAQPREMETMS
ncbi:epithelial cell adhesion molecule [Rhinichthys klamathensis goyatoka]|uniref:epithelial cell adhesion molecule n=1 Tax=Rhinichthys klamathensis goyatoka TaxID=3034132 RepID=UPI0024B50217|nr:epithelial cell adhesion molecule [Rhinichthys klamathensis goyatoka]